MSHIGEASKLSLQPVDVGGTGPSESLQSNDLVSDVILDFVDDPHSARAQTAHDPKAVGAGEMLLVSDGGAEQIRRVLEKRAHFLVDRQEAHHVGPEVGIVAARAVNIRLARVGFLQHGLLKDRQ